MGHSVCHIYFASPTETLEKYRDDRNVNANSLNGEKPVNTSKHKFYKYLFYLQMPLHKISNSVFRESSSACVTCEPRQFPVLALKQLVLVNPIYYHDSPVRRLFTLTRREIALDFSTIYRFNLTPNHSDSQTFIFMTHFLRFCVCQHYDLRYFRFTFLHLIDVDVDFQLQTLF